MFFIVQDFGEREQAGQIAAGFTRQPQRPEIRLFAGLFIAPDRAFHLAFAGVISRQRMLPVAVKAFMQHRQVIQGRIGRGNDIPPAVVPPVMLQAIMFARAGDKLPDAGGMAARIGEWLIGALDNREQGQIERHGPLF